MIIRSVGGIDAETWRELVDHDRAEVIIRVEDSMGAPAMAALIADAGDGGVIVFAEYILTSISRDLLLDLLVPLSTLGPSLRRAYPLDGDSAVRSPRIDERLTHLRENLEALLDGTQRDPSAVLARCAELAHQARAEGHASPVRSVDRNRHGEPAVHRSGRAVKADAAERLFDIDASNVTWAIVDTGIDDTHPAFPAGQVRDRLVMARGLDKLRQDTVAGAVTILIDAEWLNFERHARHEFDDAERRRDAPNADHGTHIAGIMAGGEATFSSNRADTDAIEDGTTLRGLCPTCRLVDLDVRNAAGEIDEFLVIVAFAYVAWVNGRPDRGRIDGVNCSLSLPYSVDTDACGGTPVCTEANRLVDSGVVVVVAAGNEGFRGHRRETRGGGYQPVSISDPGNAEQVITVGATSAAAPHSYGPLSISSRGPTVDGRMKPDLLAPGHQVVAPARDGSWLTMTGTSQAAAHVSAAAAMLLARHPELQGDARRVKQLLLDSAMDLGRVREAQGHGMVDVLRALQSL